MVIYCGQSPIREKILNLWLKCLKYLHIVPFLITLPEIQEKGGLHTWKNQTKLLLYPSVPGLQCWDEIVIHSFSYTYFVCESIWDVSGRLFLSSVGLATTTWLIGTGIILLPRGTCHCWGILVQLCWSGTLRKLWSLNPCRLLTRPITCEQVPLRLKAEKK